MQTALEGKMFVCASVHEIICHDVSAFARYNLTATAETERDASIKTPG